MTDFTQRKVTKSDLQQVASYASSSSTKIALRPDAFAA